MAETTSRFIEVTAQELLVSWKIQREPYEAAVDISRNRKIDSWLRRGRDTPQKRFPENGHRARGNNPRMHDAQFLKKKKKNVHALRKLPKEVATK